MSKASKAIIIGSGPAGLAAALRLKEQNRNLQCTIYELRKQPTTIGGAIGIMPNGMRLLARLGLHGKLTACGSSAQVVTVHSVRGQVLAERPLVGDALQKTGFGYLRIKRTALVEVLLEAVKRENIPIHYDKRIVSIKEENDQVHATFSDGTVDSADFMLGCDGIHSAVRTLYVDPNRVPEYTGMAGLGGVVPLSESARATMKNLGVTLTEDGMFITAPCTARHDEVFWGLSREVSLPESGDVKDGWEVRRNEEVEHFKETATNLLKNAEGEWGSLLKEIVESTGVVNFYPVHKLPPGRWARGRVLLLGDAAHAMPPHAGQGVSMALEDIFILARVLQSQGETTSLEAAFERVEEIRKPRIADVVARSVENGKARRKTTPLGLWAKEMFIWTSAQLSWFSGIFNFGIDEKHLQYDVDQEAI
ncbi:unnamed protein product [Clonostachys rosea f. rosea IK726]|uniref:Uncharacterized protein n=1 Tax=Clonostachys rosea f. rosea IK726 TaxID=1349383 RepID=A0ACA9TYG0_BIOOC|nr:unnamed protein product [Clonostachys rosea f. rosea IK726]